MAFKGFAGITSKWQQVVFIAVLLALGAVMVWLNVRG